MLLNILKHTRQPPQIKNNPIQMSTVPALRNPMERKLPLLHGPVLIPGSLFPRAAAHSACLQETRQRLSWWMLGKVCLGAGPRIPVLDPTTGNILGSSPAPSYRPLAEPSKALIHLGSGRENAQHCFTSLPQNHSRELL